MKIFKFPVPITDRLVMRLPRGAELVHVGEQGGEVQLWALVDPAEREFDEIELCVTGTGHDWPAGFRHLATVQPSYGLVWHVGVKE